MTDPFSPEELAKPNHGVTFAGIVILLIGVLFAVIRIRVYDVIAWVENQGVAVEVYGDPGLVFTIFALICLVMGAFVVWVGQPIKQDKE